MIQSSRQTILIVEQDDPTRELYERALSRDYCVLACRGDHDALELLRTRHICAVVLEPALSDSRGWELLAVLKQAAVPVILCSTLDERKRGQELGAVAYLIKPVLPTTLRETLRRVIDHAG